MVPLCYTGAFLQGAIGRVARPAFCEGAVVCLLVATVSHVWLKAWCSYSPPSPCTGLRRGSDHFLMFPLLSQLQEQQKAVLGVTMFPSLTVSLNQVNLTGG